MEKQSYSLSPVILADIQEVVGRTKQALKNLEGKTVLITGAAGFLPSYYIKGFT